MVARPVAPADADDDEPIPVPQLDALPWTVRWMCAGAAEASGMVEAVARAADAQPLFGALKVRALVSRGWGASALVRIRAIGQLS